ncbi:MAG: family 16 glycosylhydrolase [Vicingus serpentipes]|nr:family 16 glycosylhydrolase [Vicingus serpentipes]
MRKLITIFILITISINSYGQICQAETVVLSSSGSCNYNGWILEFEDNFNGNSLDLTKWNPWTGVPRDYDFVHQKAWHQPENIEVSNGTLKIISKKLSTPYTGTWVTDYSTNPPTTKTATFDYTTGEIRSSLAFGYGKFEIKCKIPDGKGFWSAFWTFGGAKWNEIDAFEIYGSNIVDHNMNAHYDYDGDGGSENCPTDYNGPDFSQSFHTFTIIWDNYKIEWYVDGQLKRRSTKFYTLLGQQVDCNGLTAFNSYLLDKAFPRDPMNIIANVAIESGNKAPDASTPFPSALEVDYIRYWKKEPTPHYCGYITSKIFPFSGVVIGDNVNLLGYASVDQQAVVIARNEIHISPNFHASAGSVFYAKIDPDVCSSQRINETNIDNDLTYDISLSETTNTLNNKLINPKLSVYPNPNSGKFNVIINSLEENVELELTDLFGKTVLKEEGIKKIYTIDLSNYSKGIYLLKTTINSEVIINKVIYK